VPTWEIGIAILEINLQRPYEAARSIVRW
jgi:hypothetical protein